MNWISDPTAWIAFLTLVGLEIVLGIDNVIFISILSGKLPPEQQAKARTLGLFLAMFMRVALLFSLAWIVKLTEPLFTVFAHSVSGRDLILLLGGLFLIFKSVHEIHGKMEAAGEDGLKKGTVTFGGIIIQIILLDIVFSLDSVITAVGMVNDLGIMISAVIVSVVVMMFCAGPISRFVDEHPTFKMLALSFLMLIGVVLVAEGMHQHISKGYIYFAMAFSVGVELLNMKLRKPKKS